MTSLHHVVLCVHPDRVDAAAANWRDLGFTFVDLALDDIGVRVLLDWDGGVELLAPVSRQPSTERFWEFLDARGDGVFSLVVRTDDIDAAVSTALAGGSVVEYRQHREVGVATIDEVQVSALHGAPLTFLQTDLD